MANENKSMEFDDLHFLDVGLGIMGRSLLSEETAMRRFVACFGTTPFVCAILWYELTKKKILKCRKACQPKHLLWALFFAKGYDTEARASAFLRTDEKTYRKWIWIMLEEIASFSSKFIRLRNRFRKDTKQRALMVIDGVDFMILEPRKNGFNTCWFTKKFNGPGIRYELGTAINTGDIVWFNGPFPCGHFPDLKIFRINLKGLLPEGELVVANKGYRGDPKIITPIDARSREHKKEMNRARSRHETINGSLKRFEALNGIYRHDLNKHHFIFKTCAIITQIETDQGIHIPFQVTGAADSAHV